MRTADVDFSQETKIAELLFSIVSKNIIFVVLILSI
jgi:hypothetical protein